MFKRERPLFICIREVALSEKLLSVAALSVPVAFNSSNKTLAHMNLVLKLNSSP